MAIVHLGAKRVQGIKTDRVSDSLGSSADGTNTGITLADGFIKQSLGSHTGNNGGNYYRTGYRALGSTLSTNWVLRFRYKPTALNSNSGNRDGDAMGIFVMDGQYKDNVNDTQVDSRKAIGYAFRSQDGNSTWYYTAYQGTNNSSTSGVMHHGSGHTNFSDQATVGEEYYVEIIKNGTTVTVTQRVGSHSASVTETETISSSLSGFTHINIVSFDGNGTTQPVVEAEIRDIELWDDTTSASGTATWSGIDNFTHQTGTTGMDSKLGTGAYSLSGTNPLYFASANNNKLLPETGDFTIACWVKHSGHSDHQQIFRSQDSNGSSKGEFRINHSGTSSQDDKLAISLNDGTNGTGGLSATVMSTNSVTQNAWVHLAVTRTGATVKLYINGTLETNQNTSGTFSANMKWGNDTPRVGRMENSAETLQGSIDDLAVWHRVLTATEISDLVNKTGDVDGLGSSADGTVTGATLDTTNEKLGSGCFSFDGSGDQVIFGSASDWSFLNSGEDFSLVFWLRPSATNATQALFSTMNDASGSNRGFSVSMTSSNQVNLAVYPSAGGGYPFANDVGTSVFEAGVWHHYALVYTKSDGNMRVYKDGSVIITQAKNGTFTAGTPQYAMMFGQRGDGGDRDYNGQVDDSAVFERALSSTEVSNLYNSGTGALVSTISTTGLKAYWNFDQNPPTNQASPTINGALVSSLTNKSELKAYYSMDSTSRSSTLDITSNSGFTANVTGITTDSNGKITNAGTGCTANTGVWKSLGFTLGSTWCCTYRYKRIGGGSPNDNWSIPISFTSSGTNASGNASASNDAVGHYSDSNINAFYKDGASTTSATYTGEGATLNTYYYIKMIRTTSTNLQFKIYNNSDFSDTPTTSNKTISGISDDLTYLFAGAGVNNNTWGFEVDQIKIFNNATDNQGCVNDFSTTSALDAYTNLPVNTIFEQTDNTPTYWFKQSDNTWKIDGTAQNDVAITNSNWNFQATSDITSDRVKVWNSTSPPYGQATHTLSSDVDGDFVLRYRLKWHAGDSYIFVGLYDELPSTLTDTTMDFCESGFYFTNNSNRGLRAYAGANTSYGADPVASSGASQTGVADTDYYIELIRDVSASTLKLNKYTSSDYTGTPETHTMSSTPSGITGLKYLKVVYSHDGTTGGTSSYIFVDQIKLQSGVSEWLE